MRRPLESARTDTASRIRTLIQLALGVACCSALIAAPAGLAPAEGEALIWYLGHAGWAVRTSEHWLVFDYTGAIEAGSLDGGSLAPEIFGDRRVILFISHGHGDHFDPRVVALRESVENLTVVMGWNEAGIDAVVPPDAAWTDLSGAEVFTLHHEFDGIPEGFFIVRSGGVTVYFSGDHGTWSDPPNATFRSNIDDVRAAAGAIDLAFLASFGKRGSRGALNAGDVYTMRTLEPGVVFPMHCGGCEERYAAFAEEVKELELSTEVGVAKSPGSSFRYAKGRGLEDR